MERLVYLLVFALLGIIQKLPPRAIFLFGRVAGLCAWATLPHYRRLAQRNIARATGVDLREAKKRTREHFCTLGANLLSAGRLMGADEATVRRHTTMKNLEALLTAHKAGRGVVLAISHIGNWELFAQAAFYAPGLELGTVYQKVHNRFVNDRIDRYRQRLGVRTFDRAKELGAAAQFLKSGGVLGVLVDQHAGDSGIWTPFFGSLASTSPLAASLALRTGAAVVPVAITTSGIAKWDINVRPEIPVEGRGVERLTADITRVLEQQILDSPADWFWVHNRWKLPKPAFLLGSTKRGIFLPPDFPPSSLKPLRIVVRTSNWLGDAVMNIPCVAAMKSGRPDTRIAVLCPQKLCGLWEAVPEVDEILPIPGGASPWKVASLLRGRFDAAVVLPNSMRSALEIWLAGIPRRVGLPGHLRRKLLNHVLRGPKPGERPEHHARAYLRIAKAIGAPIDPGATSALSRLPRSARRDTPEPGRILVGVCPGAEYGPAKRWPHERFRTAMEIVAKARPGIEWVLLGVANDAPITSSIASNFTGNVRDMAGKTSLAELMEELRNCDCLLTNDTGTMHLAAFLGTPTVAVFGSTEPLLTGPIGEGHAVLRHHVECSPCFLRECPLDFRCMNAVAPAEAAAAVLAMIDAHRASQG